MRVKQRPRLRIAREGRGRDATPVTCHRRAGQVWVPHHPVAHQDAIFEIGNEAKDDRPVLKGVLQIRLIFARQDIVEGIDWNRPRPGIEIHDQIDIALAPDRDGDRFVSKGKRSLFIDRKRGVRMA